MYLKKAIRYPVESRFALAFFDHENWEYQPGPYTLSNGETYRPDFLDKNRNVLIEVVGSRQAMHKNKHKYTLFRNDYPSLTLEFRNGLGDLLDISKILPRLDEIMPIALYAEYGFARMNLKEDIQNYLDRTGLAANASAGDR